MLDVLNILQKPPEVKRVRGGGHENRLPKEVYHRCRRIIHWLLIWQTSSDCINNAFLVNGLVFDRWGYPAQLHGTMRKSGNYKPHEKFHKYRIVKEMKRSGATFKEMYQYYYGIDSKFTAQKRFRLNRLIGDVK